MTDTLAVCLCLVAIVAIALGHRFHFRRGDVASIEVGSRDEETPSLPTDGE